MFSWVCYWVGSDNLTIMQHKVSICANRYSWLFSKGELHMQLHACMYIKGHRGSISAEDLSTKLLYGTTSQAIT